MENNKGYTDDLAITMKPRELYDLIYRASFQASRKTNGDQYHGLVHAFLDRFDHDFQTIHKELDYLKSSVKTMDSNKVEIDYKLLAKEMSEVFKDVLEVVIEAVNDNTKDQIDRVLGGE